MSEKVLTLSELIEDTKAKFRKRYSTEPEWVAVAPGRVNVIGEHTDYNGGFVFPMAIERYTVLVAAPSDANNCWKVRCMRFGDDATINLNSLNKGNPSWSNYLRGVISGYQKRGIKVPSLNIAMNSTVPLGGGLSSSAALEIATGTLIEAATQTTGISKLEKALIGQYAEHEFAGVPCGIMDQFISSLAQKNHLMLLDCKTQEPTFAPMNDEGVSFLIINSNVKHQLSGGEYASRRAQCEAAAKILNVSLLRDANMAMLESVKDKLSDLEYRRAKHVITEDERTLAACKAFAESRWEDAGQLMYASHDSLRDDFEVSCKELDILVEICREIGLKGGIYGCRMTGGGFGGCTVALVRTSEVENISKWVTEEYRKRTKITCPIFSSHPADGAMIIRDDIPHRRYNLLTGEWVLVSPHRAKRPWQGQVEKLIEEKPAYDEKCYLCPGNKRVGGTITNPVYTDTFVFRNDFSALLPETEEKILRDEDPFFQEEQVHGECRVICFSPRHDLTLPELSPGSIEKVIDLWQSQSAELSKKYKWVQIFENKGSVMGCSNPHPHGQIWAGNFIPTLVQKEEITQKVYWEKNHSLLLLDYAKKEIEKKQRVVCANDDWAFVVPFWATWPYEYLLLPLFPIKTLIELTNEKKKSLAQILKEGLTRYDNLFQTSFPYSMGWHGAPYNGEDNSHWQLHAHYYPPLLRSATVKKFMVGYEMMAESQRDLTAEQAAQKLRNVPSVHYKQSAK